MSAWDPHLNRSVALTNLTINGTTQSYFNPYNLTGEPFFLSLAPLQSGLAELEPGTQLYAFHYAVQCVIPISGIYCPLNRWLVFAEIFFGLIALSLGYEWLSVISIAAAVNYTAVAAIHAIVLYVTMSQKLLYFTYDISALYEILGVSMLLAHPLQQWSQTLQRKTFAKTRFIVACWCVLVCIAFIIVDVGYFQTATTLTGIASSSRISAEFGPKLNNSACESCYNDTISPYLLSITPKQWQSVDGQVSACPDTDPAYLSSVYVGQNLVPDLFPGSALFVSHGFLGLDYAYSIYAAIASVATIALAFHGRHSTLVVRAKMFLWLRGKGTSHWCSKAAVLVALLYHGVQFLLGIVSLPIVIVDIVIWEYSSVNAPTSEQPTDLGQWGPCVGALLLACAVILNTGSTAHVLRSTLAWVFLTPAHVLFPSRFKRRHLPRLEMEWSALSRMKGLPRWLSSFFLEEYRSTREWLRSPYEASLKCIVAAEAEEIEAHELRDKRKSTVTISRSRV